MWSLILHYKEKTQNDGSEADRYEINEKKK